MASSTRSSPASDVPYAPVVLEWESVEGEKLFLGDPDPRKSKVIFESQVTDDGGDDDHLACYLWVRVPVQLKAFDGKHIYVQIHPRNIMSLRLETNVSAPDVVLRKLATSVSCLVFELRMPADIVVPATTPLRPYNGRSGQVLDAIRSLGRATRLTLYIPAVKVAKLKLERICAAITRGRSLKPLPRYTDLGSLYGGHGGKLLEQTITTSSADEFPPSQGSPPPYDDVEPGPPLPPLEEDIKRRQSHDKGRKRPRPASSGSGVSEPARTSSVDNERERKLTTEAHTEKVIQELRAELRAQQELIQTLQRQVQTLDRQLQKQQELTQTVDAQLGQVSDRVDRVEDNIDALDVDVQEHKSDLDELEARIERIEQDELSEMETRIKQDITETVTESVLETVREEVVNSELEATVKLNWAKT